MEVVKILSLIVVEINLKPTGYVEENRIVVDDLFDGGFGIL